MLNDTFNIDHLNIMIVDDSPSDRMIFRRFLSQNKEIKFDFSEYETVESAISELNNDSLPDCVLLDYDLPDFKGTQFIRNINELLGRDTLPIVMLSGSGSLEVAVEAMSVGAQDYLVKSRATPADLIRAVMNAMEKVRLLQEKESASEKVKVSEERYRLLFENTPLPAIVFDCESSDILAANDYAIVHYGFSRDEFLRMKLHQLEAEPGELKAVLHNDFCGQDSILQNIPSRHRKKNGELIDVEINCHDIAFEERNSRFMLVQDITSRKAAEAKIKHSEEFNRTIIESSPDCVKLLDQDGKLQFMNENGLCLMEIDDFTQFKDREWHELWTPECQSVVKQTVEMAKLGEVGRFEGFCPTAKGSPRWWDVIVTPITDIDGKVDRILSVSRDITESKLIEQERESILVRETELRQEAESANRAKDEFLAVISHELRTPLNAIYGWAKILNQGNLEKVRVNRAVEVIEKNIRLQNNLIDDLLDVSRIIAGKIKLEKAELNFCRIVADSLETTRFAADEKNIKVVFEEVGSDCFIYGDVYRIQQVINNLLTNAIKFTPSGGKITVKQETKNGKIILTVTDTGIGIEKQLLPHIFERFKQADGSTKRKYGGLGLGLAIAKSLTEMHNGKISADSPGINQGTTMTVEFPLANAVFEETDEKVRSFVSRLSEEKPLHGIKLFVVDDDSDSLELMRFVLQNKGAEFYGFSTAQSVLEGIKITEPDVLLSDISMAGMDGYDLIHKIRELPSSKDKFIPAIAMTAYASVEDRASLLSAGFQMHIPKPVDISELTEKILEVLDSYRK